jgi:hypothetical protein
MLNIVIPDNNISEREYIITTILSDFLGLHYNLIINASYNHYSISFNDKELVIDDSFFNLYPDVLSYLETETLPKEIIYAKNEFTGESDIPVIYGSDDLFVTENKIICGIDIFASSFFMLTRWEEYVNKSKDEHMRFPGNESIAFKNGFLHRPIVNEYVEMLWGLLIRLGFKGERKKRSFELVLTHDIDHLDYPCTYRIILGDILKRKNLKLATEHFKYFLIHGRNPYDTFDFIMTSSEKLGLKSHFYFMSSDSKLPPDISFYLKSKRFRKKVKEIISRDHKIGFHPGYYTYNNLDRWTAEKQLLDKALHKKVVEGRQHYLRFDIPGTFRIWAKNKMEIDSTLGYSHKEGFRCGTGDVFSVFDFLERRQIHVKERPLIIMDGSLRLQYSQEQALKIIQYYISVCRKYNSTITLLFHNSSFYAENWEGYDSLYIKSLNFSS